MGASYPNFAGKHEEDAFFNPGDFVGYLRRHGRLEGYEPPASIILCYQRTLLEHVLGLEDLTKPGRRASFRGLEFRRGASWTIDTRYQETVAEARHYQNEGVLCVEREAAPLFAGRPVPIGRSRLRVRDESDSLADLVWDGTTSGSGQSSAPGRRAGRPAWETSPFWAVGRASTARMTARSVGPMPTPRCRSWSRPAARSAQRSAAAR